MRCSETNRTSWANRPWSKACLAAACVAIFSPAFGQMAYPPKINLNDTTITTRDSLRFAPQTFGTCLYSYQSHYEIIADASMDSISRYLIRLTSRQNPNCAAAAGYSGPIIVLKNLPLGTHKLVFTDSSDFKVAIPDSVRIRVIEQGSNALKGPRNGRMHPRPAVGAFRCTVNGRLAKWAPMASRTFLFLHK